MIVLFTRVPVPGKVKTRLSGVLTPGQCARLQEAMILDAAERLSGTGMPLMLCHSDEADGVAGGPALLARFIDGVSRSCAPSCELHVAAQEGEGLGARMDNAMRGAFARGAGSCLLIGSDLPGIAGADMKAGERALARRDVDVVLGPSGDGGYWLVGAKEPFSELFAGKRYGGGPVLAEALATCRRHGKAVALLREASDVDVPDDLARLCGRVRESGSRPGPRTAAMLDRLVAGGFSNRRPSCGSAADPVS